MVLPLLFLGDGGQGLAFGPYSLSNIQRLFKPRCSGLKTQNHQKYVLKFYSNVMDEESAQSIVHFFYHNKPKAPYDHPPHIITPLMMRIVINTEVLDLFGIRWQYRKTGALVLYEKTVPKHTPEVCRKWFHSMVKNPLENFLVLEIQRYGGISLSKVVKRLGHHGEHDHHHHHHHHHHQNKETTIVEVWMSWIDCLQSCVHLIEKGFFISDLKPGNMVVDVSRQGGIVLNIIDANILPMKIFKENKDSHSHQHKTMNWVTPTRTIHPMYMPRQMINRTFDTKGKVESLLQRFRVLSVYYKKILMEILEDLPDKKKLVDVLWLSESTRKWPKETPAKTYLTELSVWNVFYSMIFVILTFLRRYQSVPFVRIFREACTGPLIHRMQKYSPKMVIAAFKILGTLVLQVHDEDEDAQQIIDWVLNVLQDRSAMTTKQGMAADRRMLHLQKKFVGG